MSLEFKSVQWRNFLSTGNDWNRIDIDTAKTTLICGKNGEGKSTFLDAVCYGLYNKPFRKINKPMLRNSINKKGLVVEIEFKAGRDKYFIRRGMSPNIFEIQKNGELINQAAANRDYQEILEKHILKMNFKSFCQIVILGSASFVPFMQLPTWQRREIVEDLLDIQIFTVMNTLLKDKVSQNNRDLTEVGYRLDMNSEKMKMHEDHLKSIVTNTQEIIDDHLAKIAKLESDIETEKAIIEEKSREQEVLIESTKDYDGLRKKISEMDSISSKIHDKIERLNGEIKFFHDHDNCPTCKQAIAEDFKESAIVLRETEVGKSENGIEKMKKLYEETLAREDTMKRALDRISSINVDLRIRNDKVKTYASNVAELNQQVEKLQKKTEAHVVDDQTTKALETEREELEKNKRSLLETREILRVATIVLKDNGIKSKIIKQYVPIINKLINKYLAAMDFFVQFELDENFNETIRSRFRDDFSYSSFSEGEKMRIDLSLLFAWRAISKIRNSASTNLLILDEIFDGSLDGNGSDDFMKIIDGVSGDTNTFVISHKTDQLLDKFERVIRFEKKQNFSRIAE